MPTFMDVVKFNNADPQIGLIEEATFLHPEINLGDTRDIPGLGYDTIVRTAIGNTGGSFRQGDQGTKPPAHTYVNRRIECYLDEPRFECDKQKADSYIDGAAAFIARDVSGTLEGEMQALAKQFYYGALSGLANSLGFPGLIDSYDTSAHVIDAGGTTANTGSSVWMVRFGPQQIQWVLGAGGKFAFSPVRIESLTDPSDATLRKRYDGYVQTLVFRPGLQVGSKRSCVRIKKLTADSGCTLTDTLLNKGLALFEDGTQPDLILMNRRSIEQLRESRTTFNPIGTPAPFPTAIQGLAGQNIPIKVTEAISNTEPLTM